MTNLNHNTSKTLTKILAPFLLLALLALAITPMACSSNPGVEVGNPTPGSPDDLKGLEIRIDPEPEEEPSYSISVLSDTQVQIAKLGIISESLIVPILNVEEGSFRVRASFSDEREVIIDITFTDSTVTSAVLIIDDTTIPSSFLVSGGGSASCSTGTTNAGLLVLETICDQIVNCTSITCEDCRANLLDESSLSNELGLDEAFGTFQDIANAVDIGTISADATALNQCVTGIDNTTCTDLAVVSFDETEENYGDLEEFLDLTPVCVDVF